MQHSPTHVVALLHLAGGAFVEGRQSGQHRVSPASSELYYAMVDSVRGYDNRRLRIFVAKLRRGTLATLKVSDSRHRLLIGGHIHAAPTPPV